MGAAFGVFLSILWTLVACVDGEPVDWLVKEPGTGLPVILSAPHGGRESPGHVLDRDAGCWTQHQCVWSHDCGQKDTSR